MTDIFYVGDWSITLSAVHIESPFSISPKNVEIFNYGIWLKKALESTGQNRVDAMPSWDFYKLAPGAYEEIIANNDLLIFSDVEAKTFQLSPSFFDREKFGNRIITHPDRTRLTVEAVRDGKGAMFLGGWLSFSGESGKGGWNRTHLKEILPVECLRTEDLVENSEGFSVCATDEGRKRFRDIDFDTFPPILGYNQTILKSDSQLLLYVKETGDPLLVAGDPGRGSVIAYTSDPAPHWGVNFVYWEYYQKFWLNCLELILPSDRAE